LDPGLPEGIQVLAVGTAPSPEVVVVVIAVVVVDAVAVVVGVAVGSFGQVVEADQMAEEFQGLDIIVVGEGVIAFKKTKTF
jgi:hypothetical protein